MELRRRSCRPAFATARRKLVQKRGFWMMFGDSVVLEIVTGRKVISEVAGFLQQESHPLLADGRVLSKDELGDVLIEFAYFSRALPKLLAVSRKACSGDRYAP